MQKYVSQGAVEEGFFFFFFFFFFLLLKRTYQNVKQLISVTTEIENDDL